MITPAVQRGATRNVYLGGVSEDITDSKLRDDLGVYGSIEKVNIIPTKKIAFVNFCYLNSAIKAVNALKMDEYYGQIKIGYGKDRCNRM
jgi:RNA recognition motif-containing protein